MNFEIGILDNETSILYKWALGNGIPVKYVLVRSLLLDESPRPDEQEIRGLHFSNIFSFIGSRLDEDQPLPLIMDDLFAMEPKISHSEAIMTYIAKRIENAQKNNIQPEEYLNSIYQDIGVYYDHLKKYPSLNRKVTREMEYPTLNKMVQEYGFWAQGINEQLQKDTGTLQRTTTIQNNLLENPPFDISPFIKSQVIISAHPKIETKIETGQTEWMPVTINDGLDIFNASIISSDVPYVQLNGPIPKFFRSDEETYIETPVRQIIDPEYKYYKVYTGEVTDAVQGKLIGSVPKYNNIIPGRTKTMIPNTITSTVWIEEGKDRKTNKDSYVRSTYNLSNNTILMTNPIKKTLQYEGQSTEEETYITTDRLKTAFPILDFGPLTEVKIIGEFNVYGVEISDISLLDMILTVPLFSNYLYIDEYAKFTADKKRIYIYYKSVVAEEDTDFTTPREHEIKNPSSVRVHLTQMYTGENEKHFHQKTDEIGPIGITQIFYPKGTPYVNVRVMKAKNIETVQQFIEVFRRLMSYYYYNKNQIEDEYKMMIPELQGSQMITVAKPTLPKGRPGAPPTKTKVTKIYGLRDEAPDIFMSEYATDCQCERQPLIVQPGEENMWKEKTFADRGLIRERQTLSFPRDDPRFHLVCPNDVYPYPGLINNKRLPNKETYPFLPCCFKTNQMDPGRKTKYTQYYLGVKKDVVHTTKSTHVMRVNRALEDGRIGLLPSKIGDLLSRYKEDTGSEFVRYGVPRSQNSLIHCVLIALATPGYVNTNPEMKEQYAMRVRGMILGLTNPSLYRQELYDYTNNEIFLQLARNDIYFDPSLYYRAIEELFNVNVYVFSPSDKGDETSGKLKIPRHKIFSARPPRFHRQTILIYEHFGAESDALNFPQCELIIDHDKKNNLATQIFRSNMTKLVHDALLRTTKTISWYIDSKENTLSNSVNLYSRIDFYKLVSERAKSQIIDSYGKARAFIISTDKSDMTLVFPPSQPENIPVSTDQVLIPIDEVLAIPGLENPSGITRNSYGQISGLWYPIMDIPYGVFIPTLPSNNLTLDRIKDGPPHPLVPYGENVVSRVKSLRKSVSLVIQLVKWLFIVAEKTAPQQTIEVLNAEGNIDYIYINPVPISIDKFVATYFNQSDDYEGYDNAYYYDFSEINRRLPPVNSVSEGIAYLEKVVPTFARDGKLLFPNKVFRKKVQDQLEQFVKLSGPLPIPPTGRDLPEETWILPTELDGIFIDENDFKLQSHVLLFLTERDMQIWLKSAGIPVENLIRTKLEFSLALAEEPYLYKDSSDKIYMVQNVYGGDYARAMNVAVSWYSYKINPGPMSKPYVGENYANVIYQISTVGNLMVRENNTEGHPVYLQILSYGEQGTNESQNQPTGRYAALLPLI